MKSNVAGAMKAIMRAMPLALEKIEDILSKSPEITPILCEFFHCNEKVLAHRILGWKQYKEHERDSCPAKSPDSET